MNPIIIAHKGKSKMQRNKTDKLDARLICDYCQEHLLIIKQSIEATIAFYNKQIDLLKKEIAAHIDRHPETLKKRHHLLTTIPGIADKSAAIILAELPDLALFRSSKQVTAYAGLTPKQLQSGQMMHQGGLYKLGSNRLRKALFYPAMTGKRHNPILIAMAQRLGNPGLKGLPLIAALMRKLLVLIYGLLKSGLIRHLGFVTVAQLRLVRL